MTMPTAPVSTTVAPRSAPPPSGGTSPSAGRFSSLGGRRSLIGWFFLIPAAALIFIMNFWPMFQALLLSLQVGRGANLSFAEPLWFNYERMLSDQTFWMTLGTTMLYLVIQVPIMLVLALILANILNNPRLRFRAMWRTAIFLPCAVSLVSYAMVFRTMFATDGLVNDVLLGISVIDSPVNWLGQTTTAQFVIILGLLWRWTGYNMVFYLAGLQNIDRSSIEAAKVDGANAAKTLWYVTLPQLKPMILLTAIMSTNGTLQLFDESYNLTAGGPANSSMSISHYLYEISFVGNPNFGYAAAISYVILVIVAVLAAIQIKVGDKRD
ncbi:sugar ABC transporter permease [Ruania suaedae]|uniref:carbohydrate ABC transporter permease n=1 Tax=Ruania suaedae TaxID=2897774 RepID=UPI001E2FEACC|nr:sugar ABC transporter permease [Ruania suaedae]UFU02550.1 sugar ABC transporter permease [Ruania suaedae]